MILPILGVTTPTDLSKININLVPQTAQVQPEKIEPTKYTVRENDNLTKIADKHQTTWQRLWNKNTHLTNQDVLNVGEIIVIPSVDEVLADRPLYVLPLAETQRETIGNAPRQVSAQGNSYERGQCTHFVASKRYVPNGWGDASSWKYNAQKAGWTVSSTPVAGAIAWRSGHVAYVESVGDGVVTISEQNYDWNSGIRTITIPVTDYLYLY